MCFALLAPALTCATSAAQPGTEWQKVAPAAVGLDAAKLNEIAAQARGGRSNCLVVVRDGKLAGEWYFRGTGPNTAQDVFSVTKSVTGTLVGIAQDDGDLRIGERAAKWIPQWRGTQSAAVTVRNLLSMDSGREWSALTDYLRLLPAPDRTAFAIGLGQDAAPGDVWAYNNAAVQTLDPVLANATGEDASTFAERRLFGPLGMTHTSLGTDRAGNPQLFEGMQSTCRDLARFGLLILNKGNWDGKRLISQQCLQEATTSSAHGPDYGYLWWLNTQQKQWPSGPASSFAAVGNGGNIIWIDPEHDVVLVWHWHEPGKAVDEMIRRIVASVTGA